MTSQVAAKPNDDSKADALRAKYEAELQALGYVFRLDYRTDRVEVNGENMTDPLRAEIRTKLRSSGRKEVNVAEDAWVATARRNTFHPVKDFLEGLTWDGIDHIGALTEFFTDENEFFGLFLRRWLIGAVARVYGKCQNRMFVLDGKQDLGKSYFVAWLAEAAGRDDLFVEAPIAPDRKDDLVRLINTWIWEVGELESTTARADRNALKHFLSMQQVTVRKPYGHYDMVKPALASFIGTVNNTAGFLNDPTGNRRFACVTLTKIDWAYTEKIDPRQVWAQAKALYDSGEAWRYVGQEKEMAKFANEEYIAPDPLEDILEALYEFTGNPADFVSGEEIRGTLNARNWKLRTPRGEGVAIATVLKGWGAKKTQVTIKGVKTRGYLGIRKPGPEPF